MPYSLFMCALVLCLLLVTNRTVLCVVLLPGRRQSVQLLPGPWGLNTSKLFGPVVDVCLCSAYSHASEQTCFLPLLLWLLPALPAGTGGMQSEDGEAVHTSAGLSVSPPGSCRTLCLSAGVFLLTSAGLILSARLPPALCATSVHHLLSRLIFLSDCLYGNGFFSA